MDLDDTLLRRDKQISDFTLKVLNECKKQGHKIVFNTARSFLATKPVINIVNPDYCILNGGSLIYRGEEMIFENTINFVTTNEIIDILKELKITQFSIETTNGLYSNNEAYTKFNSNAIFFDFDKRLPYDAYKVLFSSETDEVATLISERYNLHKTHYLGGTWYRLACTNKHEGNMDLYKILGDESPKSIVFGDDIGDLEMINKSYHGVALKNSQPSVLENCENVTKYSNDEDGLAVYLNNMLGLNVI